MRAFLGKSTSKNSTVTTFDSGLTTALLSPRHPQRIRLHPAQADAPRPKGHLVGPLGNGEKNSFLISAEHDRNNRSAVVFAETPAGVFRDVARAPEIDTEASFRYNRHASYKLYFFLRYAWERRSSFAANRAPAGLRQDQEAADRALGGCAVADADFRSSRRVDPLAHEAVAHPSGGVRAWHASPEFFMVDAEAKPNQTLTHTPVIAEQDRRRNTQSASGTADRAARAFAEKRPGRASRRL